MAFSVETDGPYTITAIRGGSNPSSRLALYKYPFDPAFPQVNILAMDNTHGLTNMMGYLENLQLEANVNYVAVASYYDENVPPKKNDQNINLHLDNLHGSKMIPTEPVPPRWYVQDPVTGDYIYLASDYSFDPFTTQGSGITNADVPGQYIFYAGCEDGECLQPAILTINPIPIPHADGNNVNCSDELTHIQLYSTVAPTGEVIGAPFVVTYTWTAELLAPADPALVTGFSNCTGSCGDVIAQPVMNTGTDAAVVRYTIYAKIGDCEAAAPITFDLIVNPLPAFTVSPVDQSICPSSAIDPIHIQTQNAVTSLSYYWTNDEGGGYLPSTGDPAPIPAEGTVTGTDFYISGVLHSTDPQNLHTATFTIEAKVNGYTCASKIVTVGVQDADNPTITCPADLDLDCADDVPAAATDYDSFVTQGGSASDLCTDPPLITVVETITGDPCNQLITRVYTATDEAGRSASCTQTITVTDDVPPTFKADPPALAEYCVLDIFDAVYDGQPEPDADIIQSDGITPARPDYYILTDADKNALYLDPAGYFEDNCSNVTLHWSLLDSGGNPISDINTPSTVLQDMTNSLFDHEIKLLGDDTYQSDIYYTLKYWLVDECGNRSLPANDKEVLIVIKPRPDIHKMNEP